MRIRRAAMASAAVVCGTLALLGFAGRGIAGPPSGERPGLGKAEGVTSGGVVSRPHEAADVGPVRTASRSVLRRGRELFLSSCAACHGLDAQGKPGTAPSLHGVGELAADFYLKTGRMPLNYPKQEPTEEEPAFGPRDIHALVSYIGTFGGPPIPRVNPAKGSVVRGQELFSLNCAGCHTVQGQGGIVIGSWVPSLNRFLPKTEKYNVIGEAVRIGPYLMPRFGEKEISEYDVNSIAAYVKTLQHPEDRGGWGIGRIGPIPEGMVTWFMAIVALLLIARLLGERAPARRRIE